MEMSRGLRRLPEETLFLGDLEELLVNGKAMGFGPGL